MLSVSFVILLNNHGHFGPAGSRTRSKLKPRVCSDDRTTRGAGSKSFPLLAALSTMPGIELSTLPGAFLSWRQKTASFIIIHLKSLISGIESRLITLKSEIDSIFILAPFSDRKKAESRAVFFYFFDFGGNPACIMLGPRPPGSSEPMGGVFFDTPIIRWDFFFAIVNK